jgi:Cache 3/Cache 2 fusion domain
MNNNFTLVDEIVKEVGGTATIFAKSGSDFVRVATNVKKDDGSEPMHDALNNVIGIYYFGYMVRGSLTGRYSADMN